MRWTRRKRFAAGALALIALSALAVWLGNSSRFAEPFGDGPWLVAHRGLAQDFRREGLTGRTCTAARMIPAGHEHLENTLPSMRAAFALGARAVELDVQRTADDRFAVFHDWRLDCRTDGTGVTRERTLAELQALDVGYGYTADGGATFPFRGKGVGLMPSLAEVLAAFPDRELVLDVKSNDAAEGALLAGRLAALSPERRSRIAVHGGPAPIAEIRARLPEVRTVTRPRLKRCLVRYLALGWTGHVPDACERMLLTVPANVAPRLWGWPHRFLRRMDAVGTRVVLLGDYGGEGFSSGFDNPGRLAELPASYGGGIWTDRIELLGPAMRER